MDLKRPWLFFTSCYFNIRIFNYISQMNFFLRSLLNFVQYSSKLVVPSNIESTKTKMPKETYGEKSVDEKLSREELMMVMERLGITMTSEVVEDGENNIGAIQLWALFDKEEPRLDEVKEAFDVFDVNKDGFLDATELQRVLFSLGLFKEGNLEDSRKMISAFDDNGDGFVDFNEFVKVMEQCFC